MEGPTESRRREQQQILIVDDNEDHRIILKYNLIKIGNFAVYEVADGQHALEAVTDGTLDLIFMNLDLPILNGWETTRRIRALSPPKGKIPIIAFTAYSLPDMEDLARSAGCNEYLMKPVVNRDALAKTITRLLSKEKNSL